MTRTLPFLALLLCVSAPAVAQDRYVLSGSSRGVTYQGELVFDEGEATFEVSAPNGSLRLKGQLSQRASGETWTGTLRSPYPSQLLTPGKRGQHFNTRLLRRGAAVELRLATGYRSLTLTGVAALGEPNAANEARIRRFYEAFVRKDGEGMAACYAKDIHFSDPVFPHLHGEAAGDMWRMLTESEDLRVEFSGVRADARYGYAHWEAHYSLFGNKIHNVIEARFVFREGEIVRHVDEFDFPRWSQQAFTKAIRLLPSRAVQHVVRRITASQLKDFQEKRAKEGAVGALSAQSSR